MIEKSGSFSANHRPGIGLVLAPVLGGLFTDKLTWRWCFWYVSCRVIFKTSSLTFGRINLPFIAVSLAVILLFFKSLKPPGGRSILARIRDLDRGDYHIRRLGGPQG